MPDINLILQAANAASQQISTGSQQVTELRATQAQYSNAEAEDQIQIGLNNALIKSTENAASLAAIAARQKIGAMSGVDVSQQGEQLSALFAKSSEAYNRQIAAAERIEQKDSVSLFDDPLQYIINQFTINDDIRAHNAALNVRKTADARIQTITAEADAAAKAQSNFAQTITQASAAAEADNVARIANIAADKAKQAAAGYNIQGIQDAMKASKEQLDIKFNTLNAEQSQAKLKKELEAFQLYKEEIDWKRQERENQQLADEFIVDNIQKGLRALHGNDPKFDLAANPKLAKQYLHMARNPNTPLGMEANRIMLLGQAGTMGAPSEVSNLMSKGVNVYFTPEQQDIKNIISKATYEVDAKISNKADPTAPKNAQERAAQINDRVQKAFAEASENIKPGSDNPYQIGKISTLLGVAAKEGSDVAKTALAQKILIPALSQNPDVLNNPDQLFQLVKAEIGKNITMAQAVDGITSLYRYGVYNNQTSKDFVKFGIVPSNSYNTEITADTNTVFSGKRVIDLTQPADVTRALNQAMASKFLPAPGMMWR